MTRPWMLLAALWATLSCSGGHRGEPSPPTVTPAEVPPGAAPTVAPTPEAPAAVPFEAGEALFAEEGLRGAFVVRQSVEPSLLVAFPDLAAERFVPASTFKIPNALIAVETGVVPEGGLTLPWDGETRAFAGWNRDHDLPSAMEGSVVWYFQEVARRIGRDRMAEWVTRLDYGNGEIGPEADSFWLEGPLAISPLEQVAFVERLTSGELPLSGRTASTVRAIVPTRAAGDSQLHAKTGTSVDDDSCLCWLVGWVEREGRVTAHFALLLLGDADDVNRLRGIRWETATTLLGRAGLVDTGGRD